MKIAWTLSGWLTATAGAAALIGALAASASDAPPATADPPAGQLLVASSRMQDPRFRHSVILLVSHDAKGAFGIAINRPLGEKKIAELLADADETSGKKGKDGTGDKDSPIEGTIQVFLGGPVEPQFGFVIHSADYRRPGTRAIGDRLAMTASKDVLRDIGRHKGPAKYLFALGYAGWGPGQLEGEIARRDWSTAPAEPDLVFDAERATLWQKALARRTREL